MSKILNKFPYYLSEVESFFNSNSLLLLKVFFAGISDKKNLKFLNLHITHNLGGGIDTFIKFINKANVDSLNLVFSPEQFNDEEVFLWRVQQSDIELFIHSNFLERIIKHKNLRTLYLHSIHFIDIQLNLMLANASNLGRNVVYMMHDYSSVCPVFFCQGTNSSFCGLPDEKDCNNCLTNHKISTSISDWRLRKKVTLDLVDDMFYQTEPVSQFYEISDLSKKLKRIDVPDFTNNVPKFYKSKSNNSNVVSLMILGQCVPHKGSELIYSLARNPNFIFYIFGETDTNIGLSRNVITYGAFKEYSEMKFFLSGKPINGIFFPGRIPETYSYTLSAALLTNLPIFAFNIGAFKSRLTNRPDSHLLSTELSTEEIERYLMNIDKSFQLDELQ
jgi:hypothetical protein